MDQFDYSFWLTISLFFCTFPNFSADMLFHSLCLSSSSFFEAPPLPSQLHIKETSFVASSALSSRKVYK
ncbi:hypothetical protein P8452_14535 [Trifolium repens]|nr:hypothetical protein P8452_14535 [Trifolium repens]